MWFVERDTGIIGRVTPDGAVTEFPAVAPVNTSVGGDNALKSILTGADGNHAGTGRQRWFTDYHYGQIGRVTPDGTVREFELFIRPLWE